MPTAHAFPKAAVFRLSLYLRELTDLERRGVKTVSSPRLARPLGFTEAQVRKDLATFGQFGRPGLGYEVPQLIEKLKRILGTDRVWPVVLVGAGNLGRALASYQGFLRQGFRIVAVFDSASDKIGQKIGPLTVEPVAKLPDVVARAGARIAVLCVPPDQVQLVADQAVASGIRAFLNFAGTSITVPDSVSVDSVDLSIRLEQLSFQLRQMGEKKEG